MTIRRRLPSSVSVNVHAGHAPTVKVERNTDTVWMEIHDESGNELCTVFLSLEFVAELQRSIPIMVSEMEIARRIATADTDEDAVTA